jgi:hypothetical protein
MGPYLDANLPGGGGGAGSQEDTANTLGVLRLDWGDEYLLGCDPVHGWWAMKHGRIGTLVTAGSAEELGQLLTDRAGAGQ